MLLKEIINTEASPQKYVLWVDLDGVLVNFHKKAIELTGMDPDITSNRKMANEFWDKIKAYTAAGNPFFETMEPMPDALILWNYVKKYKPHILSATGNIHGAAEGKLKWVIKNLGQEMATRTFFVENSRSKSKYATPDGILIDDRPKSIDPWIAAGGIGILHKNAASTIQKLKELGL